MEEGVKRSIVCANVWKQIPVLRQTLRGYEKTWKKCRYVKPDPDNYPLVVEKQFDKITRKLRAGLSY